MKRKLSLIVLVAMLALACFGVLAACKGGLDSYQLERLSAKVESEINKAQGKTSYVLSDVVTDVDTDGTTEFSCSVKWEIVGNDSVTINNGTVTVPAGVTSYILKGTLVDENGKAYDVEPIMKSVSVVGENQGGNQGGNEGGNQGGNQGGTNTPSGDKGTSQSNPYTVAEALAIISGLEQGKNSDSKVYVKGIVSDYIAGNKGQYKCSISDTESGSKITVYYADLGSGVTSFKNGDTIVAYGYLIRFWDNKNQTETPEIAEISDGAHPLIVSIVAGSGGNQGGTTTPGGDNGNQGGNVDGTVTASISLMGNSTVKSSSATENVFESNGITVTNSKATYDKDLAVQETHEQRFYANTTVKIEYTSAISKIVITLDSQGYSKIEDGSQLTLDVTGATVTVVKGSNGTVTIELSAPVTSVTLTLAKQIRAAKIDVYAN